MMVLCLRNFWIPKIFFFFSRRRNSRRMWFAISDGHETARIPAALPPLQTENRTEGRSLMNSMWNHFKTYLYFEGQKYFDFHTFVTSEKEEDDSRIFQFIYLNLQKNGLSSSHIIWAQHSETETELLNAIPGMQKANPTWDELRSLGIAWWLKNTASLRICVEKVGENEKMRFSLYLDIKSLHYIGSQLFY